MRFRFVLLPLKQIVGPWRDDAIQPREDALEAGLAHRDEHDPARIYLDELVEIEADDRLR